jgi:ABC-2 type transport system permease protein
MRTDILTIMWKESKSLLRYGDNRWKGIAILVTPVALFGILIPIQFREGWLTGYWSLGIACFTPLLLIASTIAESFAGERERHTLETLLASRLPDRAILFGKLLTSVTFGWGMTMLLLFVSLMVVNLLDGQRGFQNYQPNILWMDILASLLMAGFVSSLGIVISLRSPTVQAASQSIMLMLFMPFLLLQAVVFLLPVFLPKSTIKAIAAEFNFTNIMLVVLAILLVVDIVLFLGSMARFQRSRLILS